MTDVLLVLLQSQPLLSFSNEHREKRPNPFYAAKPIELVIGFQFCAAAGGCVFPRLGLIDAGECNPTFGAGETSALTITDAPHSLKIGLFQTMKTSAASPLEDTQSCTPPWVLSLL